MVKGTIDWLVSEGKEELGGLTDATGDLIENAVDFGNDAKEDFKEYVTDPVMKEVETAQDWSHIVQGDLKDGANWAATKAAEGYVEKTDFLFGDEGWFADVTDPVEQAWAATENGNYLEASLYTGEAFLNSVDIVGTGGIGKMTYDWIMGTQNADDPTGPLYWEVLSEEPPVIMCAYENEESFFQFPDTASLEKFILKLEAESEGSGSPEWTSDVEKDYEDYDTQGTENHGYAQGGDTAGDDEKIAAKYDAAYREEHGLIKGGVGR